jgi:hypothetical protein
MLRARMSGRNIIPWVVVPFVGLCALAFWLTREEVAPRPPEAQPVEPRPVPPVPEPLPAAPPAPAPSAAPPSSEPALEIVGSSLEEEDLRVALQSVEPLVRECFLDVAGRYPGPQTVKLRFTLVASGTGGRFQEGEVVESTVRDPFALACFLEALTDVQFPAPRGEGVVTVTYPFHFQSAADAGP